VRGDERAQAPAELGLVRTEVANLYDAERLERRIIIRFSLSHAP
jgi:hypothetical protein